MRRRGRLLGSAQARAGSHSPADTGTQRILALLDQRSPLAIELAYDRCSGQVYAAALALLRDPALAEDATMSVFLRFWRGTEVYNARLGSLADWMRSLVYRDVLRSRERSSATEAQGGGSMTTTWD